MLVGIVLGRSLCLFGFRLVGEEVGAVEVRHRGC